MQKQASVFPINQSLNFNQSTPANQPTLNKPKLSVILPTNRMNFDKQVHLLRGYANAFQHFNRPLKTDEVGDVAKIAATTISTANAFFLDLGLIQKNENGFVPSEALMEFNHAFEWNPETASTKLAPAFQETWFAKRILPKLMMSKMSEEQAITELASAISAPKECKSQIKTLIDFLNWVGLIRREGDWIQKGTSTTTETIVEMTQQPKIEKTENTISNEINRESQRVMPQSISSTTAGAIQFNISVKVDMAEMSGWSGEQISSFFSGIAQVLAAKAVIEQKR